jgi:hypothetical protein
VGDTRDPETDQPAPKPGGYPVQAVLIEALKQRMQFGLKKYGRPLETNNGRDPLLDMWEEMLDMVSYFTQFVLEQGVKLPGLEAFASGSGSDGPPQSLADATPSSTLRALSSLIPQACGICRHEPHVPEGCRADAPGGLTNCQCGVPESAICSNCRHDPHEPGRCRSKALNLGCDCLNEGQNA